MVDKFIDIEKKILNCAKCDTDIKAIVAIGSSTRDIVKADEFSDLDLIVVTNNINKWFSGEYPELFGSISISFIEDTLGGGKEIRCIYDDDKDVDMIIFTPEQFETGIKNGTAEFVMNRGYRILYDSCDCYNLINQHIKKVIHKPEMSQDKFTNIVNDFYFHNIWAYKKLLRGEMWSAKMCIDAYLKNYLLQMIELYYSNIKGVDVWHNGRFLDKWIDRPVLEKLKGCFAHYDCTDMKNALVNTHKLFSELSNKIAQEQELIYPKKAEECARNFLINNKYKLTL